MTDSLIDVPLGLIDIEGNPREEATGLSDLAESIREHGVLQPIRVVAAGDRYRLVYGQRRVLASRLAGRETIPATVATGTDAQSELAQAIVENIQREDLNAIDEARAIDRLVGMGLTQGEIAMQLGRSPSHVSNRLRLLRCDPFVVEAVAAGTIGGQVGTTLASLPQRQQRTLAKRVIQEHWSQHKLEDFLRPQRIRAVRTPTVPIAPLAPEASESYAASLGRVTTKIDERLASLMLWAIVEMDMFIQGRFMKRHPMGFRHGEERTWMVVAALPPSVVSRELATVLGEMIAEYGSPAVKAAVPNRITANTGATAARRAGA